MADRVNRDLSRRTPGEELWCARRAAGLTTLEAARRLGVCRTTLWAAERDLVAVAPLLGARIGLPALLALARRRAGLTLRVAAAAHGVSHVTYGRREGAAHPGLVRFWERRGFTFVHEGR